jgi:hypothetical protein
MRQLNRPLLIMPLLSRLMVSTGPATNYENRAFLSQEAASVLSGCDMILRTSKSA